MRRYVSASAVFALACGSRSGLLDTKRTDSGGMDAGVGAGGLGGLGGSSGTGSGAPGGGAGDCSTLTLREPRVSVQKPAAASDLAPDLAPITNSENVALGLVRNTLQGTDPFANVQRLAFSPWAAWPPNEELDPAFSAFVSTAIVKELRIAPSQPDQLALLVAFPICVFAPHVPLEGDNTGPSVSMLGTLPTFLSANEADRHLVGCATPTELSVTVTLDAGGFQGAQVACASSAVFGGATPSTDGWLLAYSTGKAAPLGVCPSPPIQPGEPTRIDVALVSLAGSVEYLAGFGVESPVTGLQVVPHADGIYIVWREDGATAGARIGWMRYVAANGALIGPGAVSPSGEAPGAFAAGALGNRLAVAFMSDPANNPPDLLLRLFDESGTVLATAGFEPGAFTNRIALLASPDARSIALAFDQNDGAGSRVDVARFDCSD